MTNKLNRKKIIEKLINDKVDTVTQWALNDTDSLREYVSESENLEDLDDDTLSNLYENAFGDIISDKDDWDWRDDDYIQKGNYDE